MNVVFKIVICWYALVDLGNTLTGELFPFQRLSDCKSQEYYSANSLTCKLCSRDKYLLPTENSKLKYLIYFYYFSIFSFLKTELHSTSYERYKTLTHVDTCQRSTDH